MNDVIRYLLLGLGNSAIYGLVALGIVVVYRGSGVVNFAHGALALTGAALFYELRPSCGTGLAMAIGILAAAMAGLLINLLVMLPMRHASPLARVIATLGVLTLGTEIWKHRLGAGNFFPVEPFLPSGPVQPVGRGIIVGQDRLWILVVAVVLTAVLWVFYRKSRFGLATSAVAENETIAAGFGWSPITVASINWFIGGALAGVAGVMLASLAGLSVSSQTSILIPALAVALLAGFSSFPMTLVGGLLIGVLESEAIGYAKPNGPLKGIQTAVPFLIIVLVLVLRGRALPLRSYLADRLPSIGTGRLRPRVIVVAVGAVATSLWLFSENWANAVITSAIFGLVALSLVVVVGYAGQLSLAQWTLSGVGALIAGRIAGDVWSLPFPIAAALGVLFTIPVGVVLSLPALRVRGVNLAVATLALGFTLNAMVLTNSSYTGGALRGTVIPDPTLFGWKIASLDHPERYGLVAIAIFAAGAIVVANLRRGGAGRQLIAVRDNERAAASMGISVTTAKVYAFAVSAALAAAGGVIIAFRNQHLEFTNYDVNGNINALLLATLGGIGWIGGAIMAGLGQAGGVVQHILDHFVETSGWYFAVAAGLFLITVVTQPDGAIPTAASQVAHAAKRFKRAAQPVRRHRELDEQVAATRVEPKPLVIGGLSVRFGSTTALSNVSLRVDPGTVVGLIGPNGAGKTTLIDAASGFVGASGSVVLGTESLGGVNARRRAAAGLTRSFQTLELIEDLSVFDNLRLASDRVGARRYLKDLFRPDDRPLSQSARAAVTEFELGTTLDRRPGELSYGQRRMVAVARAVASAPSVLLLDEPAAGLDDQSRQELARMVRRLADEWGIGVLLVEHDVDMVMKVCDHIVALNFGVVIAEGTPAEVRADTAVVESFLGASADPTADPALPEPAAVSR